MNHSISARFQLDYGAFQLAGRPAKQAGRIGQLDRAGEDDAEGRRTQLSCDHKG